MTRNTEKIKILMEDGCTREDAIRHLSTGTIIFDDFEEHIASYCIELAGGDEDLKGELRKMVENKTPLKDWGIVEMEGKTYYIMYCL